MCNFYLLYFTSVICLVESANIYLTKKNIECGPYGFICEGKNKLRLCEGDNIYGPAFLCPPNSICNEDSNDVCENAYNYVDPVISKNYRCHRNERIADPNVPDCKGYILCIANKNRFQGIRLKCTGNTIFNGYTRTCSSIDKYKCPISNHTKTAIQLYGSENRRIDSKIESNDYSFGVSGNRAIDCKNYNFSVSPNTGPVKAAYFCPTKPSSLNHSIRCTVFSDRFCLTLEKEDQDQFAQNFGLANRRPRISKR